MGAQELLFIGPPEIPEEAVEAERYARQANLAFLPTIQCDPSLLQGGTQYGPPVVTAVITSPQPGAVLTQRDTHHRHSAVHRRIRPCSTKLRSLAVPSPTGSRLARRITTASPTASLENLYVPGLGSGNFTMRLVLVDNGGGFLQAPYEVPFSVP